MTGSHLHASLCVFYNKTLLFTENLRMHINHRHAHMLKLSDFSHIMNTCFLSREHVLPGSILHYQTNIFAIIYIYGTTPSVRKYKMF
jgi:hypothetical protein